jgi:hypothetical protein
MGLLGYHFYAVKNGEGVSHLPISKDELRRPGRDGCLLRRGAFDTLPRPMARPGQFLLGV